MKTYAITFRSGTVTNTVHVMTSNNKKAKKIARNRTFLTGASIYKMQRVG